MESPLAPEPILRASLQVLYRAAYMSRDWTLNDDVPRRQLNVLWEALRGVPSLLQRWPGDEDGLDQLRQYLAEADWLIPDLHLTTRFDQVLSEAG